MTTDLLIARIDAVLAECDARQLPPLADATTQPAPLNQPRPRRLRLPWRRR